MSLPSLSFGSPLEVRVEPPCLCPTTTPEGEFTFSYRSPGTRHYLEGEPVHAGNILEMQCDDGAWVCVRYEYTYQAKSQTLSAFVHLDNERCMKVSESARFRWQAR